MFCVGSCKKFLCRTNSLHSTVPHRRIPAVASSLEEALNSLEKDYEFLTQGGVFAKDFIEAFINIKRKEVERLNMTPHPVEFEMYYA